VPSPRTNVIKDSGSIKNQQQAQAKSEA